MGKGGPLALSDETDGPLPGILLALAFVSGLVDAASYLLLGHVFVVNMTGNVVFVGFAIAGVGGFSLLSIAVALVAFVVGAALSGRLAAPSSNRGKILFTVALWEAFLLGVVALIAPALLPVNGLTRYAAIGLMAAAMGAQNGGARRLGVPDVATNVLTTTLTVIAADGLTAPGAGRRVMSVLALLLGGVTGALAVGRYSTLAFALPPLVLVFVSVAAGLHARSQARSTRSR